jgi:hypothetical protein
MPVDSRDLLSLQRIRRTLAIRRPSSPMTEGETIPAGKRKRNLIFWSELTVEDFTVSLNAAKAAAASSA